MLRPPHGCIPARIAEGEEMALTQEAAVRTRTVLAANPTASSVARLKRFMFPPTFVSGTMMTLARLGTPPPLILTPERGAGLSGSSGSSPKGQASAPSALLGRCRRRRL